MKILSTFQFIAATVLIVLFVHIDIQLITNYSDETVLLLVYNTLFAGLFIMFCKFFAGYLTIENKGYGSKVISRSQREVNISN